jgi:hypothetical protein
LFKILLDVGDIVNMKQGLQGAIKDAMKKSAAALTAATRAHIVEEANKKLKTRRQKFIDALTIFPADDNTWIVNLDRKARWIDDGMDEHEMIDDLLKSPKTKTSKDGSRYLSIPFDHSPGKGSTGMTPAQGDLVSTIKKELKAKGIPFGKIETGPDGKPKQGVLHQFSVKNAPLKTSEGPGQGKGPMGAVRQGPTGIPFLQGIRISQANIKGKDGKDSTKRAIMTFRTVSSKMRGSGRWTHPGLKPMNFMAEGAAWAQKQWEQEVGPQTVANVIANL